MSVRSRRFAALALGAFLTLVGYLAFWPVPIAPVAFTPPPDPGFDTGRFARTQPRAPSTRFAHALPGPEAFAFDDRGRLVTGTRDGAIVRIEGDRATEITNTGGRPLGMVFGDDGTLYVADAKRGLLAVAADGTTRVLVDSFGGRAMRFVDDVDRTPSGTLVFSDASQRFPIETYKLDLLEHRPTGRIFEYDPATGRTERLADGLQFANGVAVSRDGSYAVVCETGAYRLHRLELVGPTRGRMRPLVEGLPGFCDNVRRDPARDRFYVALPSPRDAALDWASPRPWARSVVARLPAFVQPGPKSLTAFLVVDGDGRVVGSVHDASEGAYGPVTTVARLGDELVLGSLSADGLARMPLPVLP